MRCLSAILLFGLACLISEAQTPVGSWSDHLIYNTSIGLCYGNNEIYSSTGSSILVFNKEYNELKKLSRINGLSETGINAINWSAEYNTLVIAYNSTNLDLVKNNTVINIPDISRKYIPGKKEISSIRINGKYALLACSFGIVVVDLAKNEIFDTWKPGQNNDAPEVFDIAVSQNTIYAATSSGVYEAAISNTGLAYYGNWSIIDKFPDPAGRYTALVYSGGKLYVNYSPPGADGDRVYACDESASLLSYVPGIFNSSFGLSEKGFIITSQSMVRLYGSDGSLIRTVEAQSSSTSDFRQAVENNGELWIADRISGLLRSNAGSSFTEYTLPGPVTNNAFHIFSQNGKTLITGGGADASWNALLRTFQASVHEKTGWSSLEAPGVSDAMRSLIDPEDPDHVFISTWGGGLLEFKNNELLKQYSYNNSPLQTIIPGEPYVRICGMAFDRKKNLWITQSENKGSLKVLKPDGSWIINPLTIDARITSDMIIAKNGFKWILLPGGNGISVFDDNNTPEIFTDDRFKKMYVEESDGDIIPYVYSVAEDNDGNIWIGTDQGPVVYYNPEKVFSEKLKAYRVRIPRNDGSDIYDYMLNNETITAIAVDGANRKWLGTANSGAYLLSPDGTLQLKKFSADNSPILSNTITSIAVDNKTGDVWLGTAKGIQSYRNDATEGLEKFTEVYAFPNPVRPEFSGNVTITGLMKDSDIRITDVSGNLVYKTVSSGGEASWDLKTYNGKRVATGVYIAFCSSSDGMASCSVKILVMK